MRDATSLFVASVFAQDVREQIASAIQVDSGMKVVGLGTFHNDGILHATLNCFDSLLKTGFVKRFGNFAVSEVPKSNLHSLKWPRLRESLLSFVPRQWLTTNRGDRMGFALDNCASKLVNPGCKFVVAREDAAELTFAAAKSLGVPTVYDQPTPHHATVKQLMKIENDEFPSCRDAISDDFEWDPSRTERKTREALIADKIVVASEFTADSLRAAGVDEARITPIPYGCNAVCHESKQVARKPIVLYVGNISLRKGIPRLLRVWKRMNAARSATLRLVGKMTLSRQFLEEYKGHFEHFPWVPRNELSRHYTESSFFVFPTVADGFGLVINEALAHGLPVLASSNNGARGFLTTGQHGLIYQHGNDDELASALETMLSSPRLVSEFGVQASSLASQWQWSHYRKVYGRVIEDSFSSLMKKER